MNCLNCSQANPEGAKFCTECGSPLAAACASCSAELQPDAKFCHACGTPVGGVKDAVRTAAAERKPSDYTPKHLKDKILRSKSAMEGERKQVTVLFVDVQGSMDAAEKLDPESWHQVMDSFFQILTDGVHRFEGTVNQYTGDGIMALFGAPIAHEDHPQRACYAALQLREMLEKESREVMRKYSVSLTSRIGIHSGDVVVGKIGDDLRMDYTAQGHTVGLAARMESLASPGTAYMSERTAGRVSGYFDLEDLGTFPVKGVKEPVGVFKLNGLGDLQTRFDMSRARGLTRFVGRDRDVETLDAALEEARQSNGQVVGIVAEAGTGKSRLCFEFVERCKVQGLRVLEGHCAAHGKNVPFLPILQVFRQYHGITEQDDDRTARERIAGRMLLLDEGFREVLPIVFDFFGVADPDEPQPNMDPESRQRRLFQVLRKMMKDDELEEPMVILVDDLHWIDGGSELFLQQMAESIADTKNLLLVNFRPEYRGDWTHLSWYRQMPLAPLGADAIAELLEDLIGADTSIDGLADKIHARTAGNPFFTEEVVQGLIESKNLEGTRGSYKMVTPIEKLEIPDTVQSILSARIDRLLEREKRVLQTAAVIGREFPEPILDAVVDFASDVLQEALDQLKTGEFIHAEALYPVAEYAFKHPLTQEVALNSQLQEKRKGVHSAVATAIEEASGDKVDERAALLAHHWEEAGENLIAAKWHDVAADWSGTTDFVEAMKHWSQVLVLLEGDTTPEADTLRLDACLGVMSYAWRTGGTREDLESYLAEGTAAAERLGNLTKIGQLQQTFGRGIVSLGDLPRYMTLSKDLMDQVETFDDVAIQANSYLVRADAEMWAGNAESSAHLMDEFIERFPKDPALGADIWGFGLYQTAFVIRGAVRGNLSRCEEGEADLYEGIEIARTRSEYEIELYCRAWLLENFYHRGLKGIVAKELTRAQAVFEQTAKAPGLAANINRVTLLHNLLHEDYEAAVEAGRVGLENHDRHRVEMIFRPEIESNLAVALCHLGEHQEALKHAANAVEEASWMGRNIVHGHARLARALALAHVRGDESRSEIEEDFRTAEELFEAAKSRHWSAHAHERRGRVAQVLGDRHEEHLRAAQGAFEELAFEAQVNRLATELGS